MKVSNNGFLICIDVMFNTLSLSLMLPNSLTSHFSSLKNLCLEVHYYAFDMVIEFDISANRAIIIDKCKEYVNFSDFKLRGFKTILFLKTLSSFSQPHNSHVFVLD